MTDKDEENIVFAPRITLPREVRDALMAEISFRSGKQFAESIIDAQKFCASTSLNLVYAAAAAEKHRHDEGHQSSIEGLHEAHRQYRMAQDVMNAVNVIEGRAMLYPENRRDEIAASALMGLLSGDLDKDTPHDKFVETAYALADKMLSERTAQANPPDGQAQKPTQAE